VQTAISAFTSWYAINATDIDVVTAVCQHHRACMHWVSTTFVRTLDFLPHHTNITQSGMQLVLLCCWGSIPFYESVTVVL